MGVYFNESDISAHDGTNFVVEKLTKHSDADTTYTISGFKYKQDVIHRKFNHENEGKKYVGDCDGCGWDLTKAQYDNVTWGDVLYLGLYLGVAADYIYSNKSVTSLDVVESDQQIINYVTWIDSGINVIHHDEWSYSPSKTYDIIICDLWAEPDDITQDEKTSLYNNYNSHLKSGGKIIIPISGETIS
tara:strand:+ start:99 stop:662 length:564 start_codon:yes stop_codon:yes gene_type:complete